MAAPRRFPDRPAHPERTCWGCDLYCAARDLRCGNGSVRTPHPAELFGDDWRDWEPPSAAPADPSTPVTPQPPETSFAAPRGG